MTAAAFGAGFKRKLAQKKDPECLIFCLSKIKEVHKGDLKRDHETALRDRVDDELLD
jgi:hypothetical protein